MIFVEYLYKCLNRKTVEMVALENRVATLERWAAEQASSAIRQLQGQPIAPAEPSRARTGVKLSEESVILAYRDYARNVEAIKALRETRGGK